MDFQELLAKFGTPLFIYDFDYIKSRYNLLKNEFNGRKSLICYAVKANSNLSLLKMLANLGAGFDCVSFNEVARALKAGADPYKIIYSGVGKTDAELISALKAGVLYINVESPAELNRLEQIAQNLGLIARISIRVNPNIDPKTHPYISTGLNENKFGVSIDEARKMYLFAKKMPNLNPIGIHFHIGSQLMDISPIFEAARVVSNFMRELKAIDIDIKFFDIGGGIGITYKDEIEPNLYQYAQGILDALKGQDETIVMEPGRFLVGNSGVFLTKVLYEKMHQNRRFVIVDGAMNDIIRPSLYGAHHEICTLGELNFGDKLNANTTQILSEKSTCDVVGPVCESGDFLGKNVLLPTMQSGEILAIKSAGAYCASMSSNYNSRLRVPEFAIENASLRQIRARETFETLIVDELEFL
ncbi:MAG: diaminopimelate decarboxylase [Campylobacter sp.]